MAPTVAEETSLQLPGTITDGVVVLDAHTLGDAEAHAVGEDDEMVQRFDAPRRSTLEEVKAAIQRWRDLRAASGPNITYAMRSADGVLMGGCEMRRVSAEVVDISYWTFPQFRSRGLASRATALLLEMAASVPGLRAVEAHVDPDNISSRRTAEKNGFVESGTVTEDGLDGAKIVRVRYVRAVGS